MRSHTPPALPVMSHTLETPALASPLVILTSGCSATAADTLHIIHHQCWYVYTDTSPCCSRVKETFCPQLRGEEEVPVSVNQLYSNLFQYTYLPMLHLQEPGSSGFNKNNFKNKYTSSELQRRAPALGRQAQTALSSR